MIGRIFKQKCGDSLKIIEELKNKTNRTVYKGIFQKYPYEIIKSKQEIINGTVLNPEIERIEFFEKEWLQNCGDSLKILKKSANFQKDRKYICQFQKYPYEVSALKCNIIKGAVNNPRIEEEFMTKIWPQNCGDDLKILEKTNIKDKNQRFLFRCQFIKYPFEVLVEKQKIINGSILNPLIEENEFIGEIIFQNCGDSLKVLEKTNRHNGKNVLYKCEFLTYPSICYERKEHILNGEVINTNLPWKSKENLKKYIQENFKKEKPSIQELMINLSLSNSHICQLIKKYELQNLIQYHISQGEKDLRNLCLNNFVEIKNNDLEILNGKEIDIYIPSKNLGIEFNGNLWHSNDKKFGKSNYLYHQEKSLLAQSKGVFLFHIWEWEWNNKKDIISNIVKVKLGIFNKKIGASRCKIKELDNKEYQNFCNENHLQGSCGAKVKFGLFYKDELVQIMSFGCPRFTSDYQWEIIRECSKLGYCIIGGKQKLWKYFAQNYNPKNCISYCDYSKFDGHSYLKLGFKKERLNKPGFVWYDKNTKQVIQRTPWKHEELKENLKIYDCGQLVFIWGDN